MPYVWIIARYSAPCRECDTEIDAGEKVVFDTVERVIYCEACAEDLEVDTDVEKEKEDL
jgi:hypothetical protein